MKLPHTLAQKVLEGLTVVILVLQFLLPLLFWNRLPNPMPTHYNAAGEVDGWGSRGTVFLTPVFSVVMWIGIQMVIYRVDPRSWNMPFRIPYGREFPVYSAVKTTLVAVDLEMVLIFAAIELVTATGAVRWIWLATGLPIGAMVVTLTAGFVIAAKRRFWRRNRVKNTRIL